MIVKALIDNVKSIIEDMAKDKIGSQIDEKKQDHLIEEYLKSRNSLRNHTIELTDVDWQALCDYITSDQFKALLHNRLEGNKTERSRARNEMFRQACCYAHAKGIKAEKAVGKIVTDISDIIKDYLSRQINRDLRLIAVQIEDSVTESIEKSTEEVLIGCKQNADSTNARLAKIEELLSISDLLKSGRFDRVETILNEHFDEGSKYHPLPEYYKYSLRSVGSRERIVSIPLSDAALQKYPPNIRISGTAMIDGHPYTRKDMSIFEYSLRHQVPIQLKIEEVTKYLGDIIDPSQAEADVYGNKGILITPPPLSSILVCEILCGDERIYDNIHMKVSQIQDDGTMVIDNYNQDKDDIYIRIESKGKTPIYISTHIHEATNRQLLNYNRFMKAMRDHIVTSIVVKENGNILIRWTPNNDVIPTNFESIEDEIDFLERVVEIEEFIGSPLKIETIYHQDYDLVMRLSDVLRGKEITGSWNSFTIMESITDEMRDLLDKSRGRYSMVYGPAKYDIELFGAHIIIPVYRFYSSCEIDDYERKKKRIEYSDNGEQIELSFKPCSEVGNFIDVSIDKVNQVVREEKIGELSENDEIVFVHADRSVDSQTKNDGNVGSGDNQE